MPVGLIIGYGMGSPDKPANEIGEVSETPAKRFARPGVSRWQSQTRRVRKRDRSEARIVAPSGCDSELQRLEHILAEPGVKMLAAIHAHDLT